MRTRHALTLADARRIMDGARAAATERGIPMSIAITDEAGVLLLLERLDDGRLHTPEVAHGKARTAAISRTPTSTLQEQTKVNPTYLSFPGRVPVKGGLPVLYEGQVVGGIGVSGGKPEDDERVCQAGLAAL
jgi:glc operon protein GlcG